MSTMRRAITTALTVSVLLLLAQMALAQGGFVGPASGGPPTASVSGNTVTYNGATYARVNGKVTFPDCTVYIATDSGVLIPAGLAAGCTSTASRTPGAASVPSATGGVQFAGPSSGGPATGSVTGDVLMYNGVTYSRVNGKVTFPDCTIYIATDSGVLIPAGVAAGCTPSAGGQPGESLPGIPRTSQEFQRLAQKAVSEGTVRVIVRLDVPRVKELTAASVSIPTEEVNAVTVAGREAADGQLRDAIGTVGQALRLELAGRGYTVSREYDFIPFMALRVSSQAMAVLTASPRVLGIEEDVAIPLDPGDLAQEGPALRGDVPLYNNALSVIGAITAWNWGFTGQGRFVAILDTGIRSTHQFFAGKTIVEACFASGASGTGNCPNGTPTQFGPGAAVHYASSFPSYDHGTHVSGIAAGNSGTLAGVAKNADIIAIQVFSTIGSSLSSYSSDSLAALNYVYSLRGTYKIAAANMSLGGSTLFNLPCDSDSRKTAIDNLRAAGIATAIATGNDGSCGGISAPACISSAVSVGSTTDSDVESSFSNSSGNLQKLFAPGSSIVSSVAASDSSYASWSGTSMATPHVTGAWALMKQAAPSASVTDLLNALRATGAPTTGGCSAGRVAIPRINVANAIASLGTVRLTMQVTDFGSTDPTPGVSLWVPGAEATVTALPATNADFVGWSGAITGKVNPTTVVMTSDKTVLASFQFIYAPAASGRRVENRSFSQREYINILTWTANPANQGLDIRSYRIFLVSGGVRTLLGEVAATGTPLEYRHRNAGLNPAQYAIVAVTTNDREGAQATVAIQ